MLSIIMPAKNERAALERIIPKLRDLFPTDELIVVDDGSEDKTSELLEHFGVKVISHQYCMGNGAAIKSGARAASGDTLVFLDADGQHQPEDIPRLLEKYARGYDMVVGGRVAGTHANMHRAVANDLFSRLASWMVGHKIDDLTSGMRVVNAGKFKRFLYLLPNGFSYPTTITMAFFRAGFAVGYVPIQTLRRTGKSHIKPLRDGMRFLLIIFKIGALYSPLKLFLPISLSFFAAGLGYYFYTFLSYHRLTNMSVLLFSTSVLIFLIGIVSEQITMLNYRESDK